MRALLNQIRLNAYASVPLFYLFIFMHVPAQGMGIGYDFLVNEGIQIN